MTGPTPGLSGKTQELGCRVLPTYCLSSLALQLGPAPEAQAVA